MKLHEELRVHRWTEYVRWCLDHDKDWVDIEEWTIYWRAGVIR